MRISILSMACLLLYSVAQGSWAETPEVLGAPVTTTITVPFLDNGSVFRPRVEDEAALAHAADAALITIRARTSTNMPTEKDETLALARALSTRNYLIARGASPLKIVLNYVSAMDYVADNITPVGRLKNQRVEIDLVHIPELDVDSVAASFDKSEEHTGNIKTKVLARESKQDSEMNAPNVTSDLANMSNTIPASQSLETEQKSVGSAPPNDGTLITASVVQSPTVPVPSSVREAKRIEPVSVVPTLVVIQQSIQAPPRLIIQPGQHLSIALATWLKSQEITLSWEPTGTLPGRARDIVIESTWQASDPDLEKTLTEVLQPFGLEAHILKSNAESSHPTSVVVRNATSIHP